MKTEVLGDAQTLVTGRSPRAFGRCAPTCGASQLGDLEVPHQVPQALHLYREDPQTLEMRSVPTDLGKGRFLGHHEGPSQLRSRLERSTPGPAQTSAPPASVPHLLPRQSRPPTPGHLGSEGGSPGRGAEVLSGDCQELGDAELLRHGGRWVGARGC